MSENSEYMKTERKRWLFFGLPFTFTTYTLTEKKLIVKKGFLSTTEDEILLYRVMDLTLKRSFWQKIFGLGTVIVLSQDKTIPNLEIKNIKNAGEFKNDISNLVEEDKNRLRMRRGEVLGAIDYDDEGEYD